MGFPGFTSSDLALTICPFDADDIGIRDFASFQRLMAPTFAELQADYYDVRREQGALIDLHDRKIGINTWQKLRLAPLEFYRGTYDKDARIKDLFTAHGPGVAARLSNMMPYRSKARSRFRADLNEAGKWEFTRLKLEPTVQDVEENDIRRVPREYPEISDFVLENEDFRRLMSAACGFVRDVEMDAIEIEVGAWQVRLTTGGNNIASNAPEGVHQDGADYIVSAFVMDRQNARGGDSIILRDDRTTVYYQTTLDPGQGLFQADNPQQNFPLFHNVTPVCPNSFGNPAVRDTFGFDLKIHGRMKD